MSSRIDYLIRKLDDLEDAIRREKREYDKARDRYDKMKSRHIFEDLKRQLSGYQTEHDQVQRARSAERAQLDLLRDNTTIPQGRSTYPPNAEQYVPPTFQHRKAYPHRPAPQKNADCPPWYKSSPNGNAAGQPCGQTGNSSNKGQQPAPPRQHQRTQKLDYEIEEPDMKTYFVRGDAVFRDFDSARDKARRTE